MTKTLYSSAPNRKATCIYMKGGCNRLVLYSIHAHYRVGTTGWVRTGDAIVEGRVGGDDHVYKAHAAEAKPHVRLFLHR